MRISQKQLESVTSLPGNVRYEHFVKMAADRQAVWGLHQDGCALAQGNDGVTVFPLWSAPEYAEVCALNEWQGFEPREITLQALFEDLLPRLEVDKFLPGVFYTPTNKGVTPTIRQLIDDLNRELEKY